MPSAREVRNRIRSVKNIGQITRALEAVSASRVRRAQARVLASRVYAEKSWEILLNIQAASSGGGDLHPLLTERDEINNIMIVLVTSDRGLAGAFKHQHHSGCSTICTAPWQACQVDYGRQQGTRRP